ncbi:hypothetical protein LINPERPRIM_LOCUS23660 [Linum perenne]
MHPCSLVALSPAKKSRTSTTSIVPSSDPLPKLRPPTRSLPSSTLSTTLSLTSTSGDGAVLPLLPFSSYSSFSPLRHPLLVFLPPWLSRGEGKASILAAVSPARKFWTSTTSIGPSSDPLPKSRPPTRSLPLSTLSTTS